MTALDLLADLEGVSSVMQPYFAVLYELASESVAKAQELTPTAFAIRPHKENQYEVEAVDISDLFVSSETKALVPSFAAEMLQGTGEPAVAIWAEAWMVMREPVKSGLPLKRSLAEEPDRIECVMISVFTEQHQRMAVAEINRATKTLGRLQVMGEDLVSGQMVRRSTGCPN